MMRRLNLSRYMLYLMSYGKTVIGRSTTLSKAPVVDDLA
jgi:hypothetical protein